MFKVICFIIGSGEGSNYRFTENFVGPYSWNFRDKVYERCQGEGFRF